MYEHSNNNSIPPQPYTVFQSSETGDPVLFKDVAPRQDFMALLLAEINKRDAEQKWGWEKQLLVGPAYSNTYPHRHRVAVQMNLVGRKR